MRRPSATLDAVTRNAVAGSGNRRRSRGRHASALCRAARRSSRARRQPRRPSARRSPPRHRGEREQSDAHSDERKALARVVPAHGGEGERDEASDRSVGEEGRSFQTMP